MEKKKLIYDGEEDILFLSTGKKVKSSLDIGDFIIDVGSDGFITGIEILNASENLKISQKSLKELQKALMGVNYKSNQVCISLIIKFDKKEKDITIPLTIDLGHIGIKTENIQFGVI